MSNENTTAVAGELQQMVPRSVLSGLVVDEPGNEVTIWVVGKPSDRLASYAAARPRGVSVVVKAGRYSRAQMEPAATRLVSDQAWVRRLGLCRVSVLPDGSGLQIGIPSTEPDRGTVAELEQWLGVGVVFETGCQTPTAPTTGTPTADR